jgi:hypothetical protein
MSMGMKETLDVINQMEVDGVIERYAIAGAVAAFYYVEPTLTEDLDLLVSFRDSARSAQSGLVSLAPILSYLRGKGYQRHEAEGIVIEGWPVQFLPVADTLDAEALAQAAEVEIAIPDKASAVRARILRPEHLVATAVRVGRPKDLVRIAQFLEARAVDPSALSRLLDRHKLRHRWVDFCRRTGTIDPLAV